MKYKFFKLTSVCLMTLFFGMKLASAAPILLTFDWTGQCDDCQGPLGARDIPGVVEYMGDGHTQDVSGILEVYYDPDDDPLLAQFEFFSFVYNGSSILNKVEASGYHFDDMSSQFNIVGNTVVVSGELLFDAPGFT